MRALLLVGVLGFGWATAASASPAVDQSNLVNNVYMAGFSQGDLAQSFTPSKATSAGAGIFLQDAVGTSGNVTIGLWTKLPNHTGATLLASGTGFGTHGSWVDVFWSPVAVTIGTTYNLVFTSSNQGLGIAGDTNNHYAGGQVYANGGYQSFPSFDYTFREYATSDIPEPASLALLAAGLIGTGMLRRRRKTASA